MIWVTKVGEEPEKSSKVVVEESRELKEGIYREEEKGSEESRRKIELLAVWLVS